MNNELTVRRKTEILEAATRIFARYGYRQTDVQYIAEDLNIGKGTIYRYFPSKEALFMAAVDQGMQNLKTRIDTAVQNVQDPWQQVRKALQAYLNYFYHNPEIIELFIQERSEFKDRKKPTYFVYREANTPRWRNLFQGLMEQGQIREMSVDRIIDIFNSLMYGTIFTAYFTGDLRSGEEQAEEILDVILYGILEFR